MGGRRRRVLRRQGGGGMWGRCRREWEWGESEGKHGGVGAYTPFTWLAAAEPCCSRARERQV